MQRREVALRIDAAGDFSLGDRVVHALPHVFLPGPQQLHRRAGHRPRDLHRLPHEVAGAAPAKAAAQVQLVHVTLFDGQFGRVSRGGQSRFAVLRRAPDLAAVSGPDGRGVHGLHSGVVQERVAVGRLVGLRGGVERGRGVARLVSHKGIVGVQAFVQHRADAGAIDLAGLAGFPGYRQRLDRLVGTPPGVGDHGDCVVVQGHNSLDTGHVFDFVGVVGLECPAPDRAGHDRCVHHAGQVQVGAVDLFARELVSGIQPRHRRADQLPVLRVLEGHGLGRCERRCGGGNGAVAHAAPAGDVGHDAVFGPALAGINAQALGSRPDQHLAAGGTALPHILVAAANAAAAAGGEIAPDPVPGQVFPRGRIFRLDLRPVALQLFGDQLGKACERALAHFGTRNTDHHSIVRVNECPGRDLAGVTGQGRVGVEGGAVSGAAAQAHANGKAPSGLGSAEHEAAAADLYCFCVMRCRHG